MRFLVFIAFNCFCIYSIYCIENKETGTETEKDDTSLSPTTVISSTPEPVDNTTCEQFAGDCNKCVKEKGCYYCEANNECHVLATDTFMPDKKCPINKRNIGTCKINLMVVMILVGVAVGIVLIGIICCCCCCCRKGGKIKLSKDDLKWARQREERRKRNEVQRQERAAKTDEIRRKYGLFKDDTPYQRFDA